MLKKQKTIVISVITALVLTAMCFGMHYLCFERTIYPDFEYVIAIDVPEKAVENQDFPWLSIIDEKYNPFWDKDYLTKHFGDDILNYEDFSDTDKYSYIVTIGRKLCSIGYKPCEARTKYFGVIPKQYIGKVSLSDETDKSKIYVYRIEKINLVHDQYGADYYL